MNNSTESDLELARIYKRRLELIKNRHEKNQHFYAKPKASDHPFTLSDSRAAKELGLAKLDKY